MAYGMCTKVVAMVGDVKIVQSLIQTTVKFVMTLWMMSFKYLFVKLINYTINILVTNLELHTYIKKNITYFDT